MLSESATKELMQNGYDRDDLFAFLDDVTMYFNPGPQELINNIVCVYPFERATAHNIVHDWEVARGI